MSDNHADLIVLGAGPGGHGTSSTARTTRNAAPSVESAPYPCFLKKGAALDGLRQGFRQILAMRDLLAARVDAALMMNGKKAA